MRSICTSVSCRRSRGRKRSRRRTWSPPTTAFWNNEGESVRMRGREQVARNQSRVLAVLPIGTVGRNARLRLAAPNPSGGSQRAMWIQPAVLLRLRRCKSSASQGAVRGLPAKAQKTANGTRAGADPDPPRRLFDNRGACAAQARLVRALRRRRPAQRQKLPDRRAPQTHCHAR